MTDALTMTAEPFADALTLVGAALEFPGKMGRGLSGHVELSELWNDTWIDVPPLLEADLPATTTKIRDTLMWTEWSHRQLAAVLSTTHPTISAIRNGTTTPRRIPGLPERIEGLHRVIERLWLLCERDPGEVRRLLTTKAHDGPSAEHLLSMGEFSSAYLAALDVKTPPSDGISAPRLRTRRPGTVALEDLDE